MPARQSFPLPARRIERPFACGPLVPIPSANQPAAARASSSSRPGREPLPQPGHVRGAESVPGEHPVWQPVEPQARVSKFAIRQARELLLWRMVDFGAVLDYGRGS